MKRKMRTSRSPTLRLQRQAVGINRACLYNRQLPWTLTRRLIYLFPCHQCSEQHQSPCRRFLDEMCCCEGSADPCKGSVMLISNSVFSFWGRHQSRCSNKHYWSSPGPHAAPPFLHQDVSAPKQAQRTLSDEGGCEEGSCCSRWWRLVWSLPSLSECWSPKSSKLQTFRCLSFLLKCSCEAEAVHWSMTTTYTNTH